MFKPTYKYIGRLMLYALTFPSLISGGCVNENGECVEKPSQEERFNLQFTISTRMGAAGGKAENKTRAADIDGEVPGSVAENYINVEGGDLQFLLFDGERKFIQELTLGEAKVVYTASDYKEYIFHCPVTAQYFKDNINTTFSFYIMALANGRSMGMTYPTPAVGSTIEEVVSGLQGKAVGPLLTDKPDPKQLMNVREHQCIPMAGLQKFTVSGPELRKSTEAIPYNISANGKDINMLRALAKIEVIDHANFEGRYNEYAYGNNENRIEKVEINGFMTAGSIIPLISEWTNADADETQQVDSPTVPESAKYLEPLKMTLPLMPNEGHPEIIIDFQFDAYAKSLNEDNCNVFSGYVYEYDIRRLTDGQQVPYIRVTTKGKQSDNDQEGSHLIPMALAEYTNGQAGQSVASLLRNHIYRFQINAINNDANLTVTWTVCPMDQAEVTLPPFN